MTICNHLYFTGSTGMDGGFLRHLKRQNIVEKAMESMHQSLELVDVSQYLGDGMVQIR
jgi:hypothetical protein